MAAEDVMWWFAIAAATLVGYSVGLIVRAEIDYGLAAPSQDAHDDMLRGVLGILVVVVLVSLLIGW